MNTKPFKIGQLVEILEPKSLEFGLPEGTIGVIVDRVLELSDSIYMVRVDLGHFSFEIKVHKDELSECVV